MQVSWSPTACDRRVPGGGGSPIHPARGATDYAGIVLSIANGIAGAIIFSS
ncbi:hypothetical protein SAMN05660485_03319 [Blastococcus fimeti]|nr:hypothetical protein SAMN05660485_03319 [Blastococcus fimeti]